MSRPIVSVGIRHEHDVVAVRQRARRLAELLGFDTQDQTRIATAVSEIARNTFRYAGGGKAEFILEGRTPPQLLAIHVSDTGPGIADLDQLLSGHYRSATGMGLGIMGARRLMDHFEIRSTAGAGTSVWLRKILPGKAAVVTASGVARLAGDLARETPPTALEELQEQNRELLRTLDELRARQEELQRLNRELEDTNRGVVALYAELDEKADHLRRADEMKSRFLSNMSHEFRTPLNSVLALSGLLLSRADGGLAPEQERQVGYIRKTATDLSELVNDLLDLAKVEAGKIVVRPVEFQVGNLFGALRGMLRPLLVNESVSLVFEEARDLPTLLTDESKVSQILRNFISNALKFTERGEVRVSATPTPDGEAVTFSVVDTGLGIAPEDQERIFEEFTQLESPVQRKVKGTGLGLPLTRRLVELLGGHVSVTSAPGAGSTFSALIPVRYRHVPAEVVSPTREWTRDAARVPVLIVEDDPRDALVYENFLRSSPFQPIVARTLREARNAIASVVPGALVVDIRLRGEDSWSFVAELKSAHATRDVPIVIATMIDDEQKGLALGADAYAVKPIDRTWLLETLATLTGESPPTRVLVIDDDEISRYVLRGLLEGLGSVMTEAASGPEGLRVARESPPGLIVVDLVMPEMNGLEVLDHLALDPITRDIPRIVFTSKALTPDEHRQLAGRSVAVLSKEATSRDRTLAELERILATLERRTG